MSHNVVDTGIAEQILRTVHQNSFLLNPNLVQSSLWHARDSKHNEKFVGLSVQWARNKKVVSDNVRSQSHGGTLAMLESVDPSVCVTSMGQEAKSTRNKIVNNSPRTKRLTDCQLAAQGDNNADP
jgi:hypothetical protein